MIACKSEIIARIAKKRRWFFYRSTIAVIMYKHRRQGACMQTKGRGPKSRIIDVLQFGPIKINQLRNTVCKLKQQINERYNFGQRCQWIRTRALLRTIQCKIDFKTEGIVFKSNFSNVILLLHFSIFIILFVCFLYLIS